MTKQETLKAMQDGKKVSHRFFSPDEWISIKNNEIITEEGYSCPIEEFFHFRSDNLWENGYDLYNKNNNNDDNK